MTNWNLRASKKTGRPTTFTERKVGLRRINSMTIAQKLTKSSFRKRPNLALQSWSSGDFKVSTMYISKTISYYFIQVSVHASISRFLPRDGLLSLSCTMRAEAFFCVFFWFWLHSFIDITFELINHDNSTCISIVSVMRWWIKYWTHTPYWHHRS